MQKQGEKPRDSTGQPTGQVWHEVMRLVLDVPDLAQFSRVSWMDWLAVGISKMQV